MTKGSFGAAGMICPGALMSAEKHVTHILGCDDNGDPAVLVVTTICAADGTPIETTQEVQPMTATNFTATKPQKSGPYLAYETLANGAVEKLNRFVTIDAAGVPISEFYQFGTDVAYTPVDTTRVEPRPIKEQMAQGTIAVTDTAAGFVAVSGIVPVANSEGENFPAHGIFHVNADADGAGAGIAYTTDGTDPANSATAVELEVGTGQSFELDTWEEIANLTMIAIDNTGDPNATATDVDVSFELNNIAPGKDDI